MSGTTDWEEDATIAGFATIAWDVTIPWEAEAVTYEWEAVTAAQPRATAAGWSQPRQLGPGEAWHLTRTYKKRAVTGSKFKPQARLPGMPQNKAALVERRAETQRTHRATCAPRTHSRPPSDTD